MIYISPKNEYPRHIGDIQLQNPDWQQGDKLPTGWVEVVEGEMPEREEGYVVYEDFPVELDGVMTRNWQKRPMTEEEIERRDAPKRAKEKLIALGLTEAEVDALVRGLVR